MPYRLRDPLPEVLRELVREIDRLRRIAADTRREALGPLSLEADALALRAADEFGLGPRELEEEARKHVAPTVPRDLATEAAPSYFDRVSAPEVIRPHAVRSEGPSGKWVDHRLDNDWELRVARLVLEGAIDLRESLRRDATLIEWRVAAGRRLHVAYDEAEGRAEWKDAVGVWDGAARQIVWREVTDHELAGVFDPERGEIVWRERRGGICGVWDPDRRAIEWAEESSDVRVAGIWNPKKRAVELQTTHQGGIAGAFDVAQGTAVWRIYHQGSAACCYWDGEAYRTSSSAYVAPTGSSPD